MSQRDQVISGPTDYAALAGGEDLDGITIIPLTASRRNAAILASGREAEAALGTFAQGIPVTIGGIAELAVVAGCRPEYMRVLVPAFELLLDPQFPVKLLTESRGSFFPIIIVNGPIRDELKINGRANVFGPGVRANATIGRALRLGLVKYAGGDVDKSALGTAYRFTCVIGEDEEHSPWLPLNRSLGWQDGEDTVALFVGWQPRYVSHQASFEPPQLLRTFSEEICSVTQFNPLDVVGAVAPKAMLFVGEDHRGFLKDAGWTREQAQNYLHEQTRRRAGVVRAAGFHKDERLTGMTDDQSVAVYKGPEDFLLISAGSGGSRSMIGGCLYGDIRAALPAQAHGGIAFAEPASPPRTIDDFAGLIDRYMDQGVTDGWPVVPPDADSVAKMVAASGRSGSEPIGAAPWRPKPITVHDAAISAYMAGCQPHDMPLALALFEFMFDPAHDQGVAGMAPSTGGYNVWFVVHGPIARSFGLNSGPGLFGPGHRENVTLGRAVRLGLMNLAGLKPNLVDRACLGQAYKYGAVIAESENTGAWGPLHAGLGFDPGQSAITMAWGSHPRLTLNDEAEEPDALLRSIAENMSTVQGFDSPAMVAPGESVLTPEVLKWRARVKGRHVMLVMTPDHRTILQRGGLSRGDIQRKLAGLSARTVGDARRGGYGTSPLIDPGQPDGDVVHLHMPERIHLVCAGGAGGATMVNQFTYLASSGYADGRLAK